VSYRLGAAARAVARPPVPVGVAPRSVVVFRALQLGDMLCAVPALRALRAGLPHARITLVGLPWARQFADRFSHYVDEFVEFPGWPGLPERDVDRRLVPGFLQRIQRKRFDLAIQLHGDGSVVNPLVQLFGARESAGFFAPGVSAPGASFIPYPDQGHEIDRLLAVTTALGFPAHGRELEFPLTSTDLFELQHALPARTDLGNYVLVHPGARGIARRWDTANFARVADALAEDGATVVLTGQAEEAALTAAVASRMHHRAIDLAGATSFGALATLIDSARLVISNDTGISHIAAARRRPSVVVFSASDPRRWAPIDADRHRVVMAASPRAVGTAIGYARDLLRDVLPHTTTRSAA